MGAAVAEDLLGKLFTPEYLEDPSPVYADLREHAPLLWHPGIDSWVVSPFADCAMAIKDATRFACDERRVDGAAHETATIPTALQSLQSLHPPENGPLRQLLIEGLHAQ
ncbi:MAG: hypothetical protein GEV11_12330, partial [Streptosporangiales bacterium]|nr:hypothetical protein [Streptosporangiales bacterium]